MQYIPRYASIGVGADNKALQNMKITHVQTTRDGVIGEDYLEIECHQIGFTNEVPLGKISVEVARELQLALSAKVGEIPY